MTLAETCTSGTFDNISLGGGIAIAAIALAGGAAAVAFFWALTKAR